MTGSDDWGPLGPMGSSTSTDSAESTTETTSPEDWTEQAEQMIEAIERPKQAESMSRGADGWLPKLDLPGFGEIGDDCGEDIPHFCDCCGGTFSIGRTCNKSRCPRCAPSWILDRCGTSREDGEDVPGYVAKLDSTARMMSKESGGESIRKHHLVFSPPMDSWYLEADDPLQRTFDVINELLKIMGAQGVVFYHPWAGKNEDHESDDRGAWKRRLFSGRDWEGDVLDELIPRGHFHAVVAAKWIPGGDTIRQMNEATGWVIKRITKRDGSGDSLESLEDMARAFTYCLSHTGIDTSGDAQGHNQVARRTFGSTYKRADPSYVPGLIDAADDEVRKASVETLGVSIKRVQCLEEVPEDEAADDVSLATEHMDDGDGDTSSTSDDGDPDEPNMVPCSGKVRVIGQAPRFLDSPAWRAGARHWRELKEEWEDWDESDGWPGG